MRTFAVAALAVALAGCGGVELLASTAITADLQARNMQAVRGQAQMAGEMMGKTNLEKAINTYQAEKGQYPKTLDELAPSWIPAIPKHADGSPYGYDPITGRLSDHPGPATPTAPTANDAQKIAQIRAAIDSYGQAVGFYPPSLAALVPTYLAEVPKSDSGQDFLFNPQDGALSAPASAAPAAPQQAAAPMPRPQTPAVGGAAGAGPMGEVMTGMAIQNEMERGGGGGAGVNAAGSYSRNKIGNVSGNYGQQQEKAMDNLGL